MTKTELRNLYPGLPYKHFIRVIINNIIKNERGISLESASWVRHITQKEFEVFVDLVGEPIEKGQLINEHTPTKEYLIYDKFSEMPGRMVRAEINEIMKLNRKYTDDAPVYERTLTPKEYKILLNRLV